MVLLVVEAGVDSLAVDSLAVPRASLAQGVPRAVSLVQAARTDRVWRKSTKKIHLVESLSSLFAFFILPSALGLDEHISNNERIAV
jgi:hypothetical protein